MIYTCTTSDLRGIFFKVHTAVCLFLNDLALLLTPTKLKTTLRKCNKLQVLKIFGMDVAVWWYFTTGSTELENLSFVAFAVFGAVSIPTEADFLLPTYGQ